jgi:hypothetical protein
MSDDAPQPSLRDEEIEPYGPGQAGIAAEEDADTTDSDGADATDGTDADGVDTTDSADETDADGVDSA